MYLSPLRLTPAPDRQTVKMHTDELRPAGTPAPGFLHVRVVENSGRHTPVEAIFLLHRRSALFRQPPDESEGSNSATVTTAAVRAARRLELRNKVLGRIIGVSEATVSRMKRGDYPLDPSGKPFELALLFVRLYRSLDAATTPSHRRGSRTRTPRWTEFRSN
jgi:hypothetical protein